MKARIVEYFNPLYQSEPTRIFFVEEAGKLAIIPTGLLDGRYKVKLDFNIEDPYMRIIGESGISDRLVRDAVALTRMDAKFQIMAKEELSLVLDIS